MDGHEVNKKIKDLDLPLNSYVVFGSGPLAAISIRKINDIDLFVSSTLFQELEQGGWKRRLGINGKTILFKGIFEASDEWRFGKYNPSLKDLLVTADLIDGVPFVNIYELRKWKKIMNRKKDIRDVDAIDEYIRKISE